MCESGEKANPVEPGLLQMKREVQSMSDQCVGTVRAPISAAGDRALTLGL